MVANRIIEVRPALGGRRLWLWWVLAAVAAYTLVGLVEDTTRQYKIWSQRGIQYRVRPS